MASDYSTLLSTETEMVKNIGQIFESVVSQFNAGDALTISNPLKRAAEAINEIYDDAKAAKMKVTDLPEIGRKLERVSDNLFKASIELLGAEGVQLPEFAEKQLTQMRDQLKDACKDAGVRALI